MNTLISNTPIYICGFFRTFQEATGQFDGVITTSKFAIKILKTVNVRRNAPKIKELIESLGNCNWVLGNILFLNATHGLLQGTNKTVAQKILRILNVVNKSLSLTLYLDELKVLELAKIANVIGRCPVFHRLPFIPIILVKDSIDLCSKIAEVAHYIITAMDSYSQMTNKIEDETKNKELRNKIISSSAAAFAQSLAITAIAVGFFFPMWKIVVMEISEWTSVSIGFTRLLFDTAVKPVPSS